MVGASAKITSRISQKGKTRRLSVAPTIGWQEEARALVKSRSCECSTEGEDAYAEALFDDDRVKSLRDDAAAHKCGVHVVAGRGSDLSERIAPKAKLG
jgi:hypothetical protein